MYFDVSADAYDRFMGRFSGPLAARFADAADVRADQRAADVGCGPGALTAELVRRLGPDAVVAVDPSEPFTAAVRERLPGVTVLEGVAEALPLADDVVDRALAQLVVAFMADPGRGVAEMVRVTRPGGVVGACAWDHAGGGSPLSTFWRAVHDLTPDARGEAALTGSREGDLVTLLEEAGLADVAGSLLTVRVRFASVDEWWEPFTFGVGPPGAYVATFDDAAREALRERCAALLPDPPFEVDASAWCAVGRVPGPGV